MAAAPPILPIRRNSLPMKMHILPGGRVRMRRAVFIPDADRSEMIELPVSCVLLRHPQGNVLFDTGCHPDVAIDPQGRWGALTKFMTPIMSREDNVISGLKAIGLGADDIDVVICSHLHTDHCGCNAFFRQATLFVHRREIEVANAPGAEKMAYLPADWDHPMPIRAISGQTDVMGDGKIVLVPLPGHTPGMTSALVALDRSGGFLLASDALSVRENLDRDIIPRNTVDAELCARSFDEIRRLERAGYTVICGHDAPQWERLRKGADAYE
jgi:glyoxylase-like metal-dependent hydrolase (beta-lactamase superfamily II)